MSAAKTLQKIEQNKKASATTNKLQELPGFREYMPLCVASW